MIFETDFREVLKQVLQKRAGNNPSYSQRAFARDLGISPSTLSEVLKGRYGLSEKKSREIALKLDLDQDGINHFCDLVTISKKTNHQKKTEAKQRVVDRQSPGFGSPNLQNLMTYFITWEHIAILELMKLESFESSFQWIGDKLGITTRGAHQAVKHLLNIGLMEIKNGGIWTATADYRTLENHLPASVISKFQQNSLQKIHDVAKLTPIDPNNTPSIVFSVKRSRVSEAKQDLKNFKKEFCRKYHDQGNQNDDVFCFSAQFYSLLAKNHI